MAQEDVFQKLASIADVASLSQHERIVYDETLRRYRDTVGVMQGQFLEGMEKGRAEGRAEGRANALRDTARKMKAKGLSTDLIMTITGLDADEVNEL